MWIQFPKLTPSSYVTTGKPLSLSEAGFPISGNTSISHPKHSQILMSHALCHWFPIGLLVTILELLFNFLFYTYKLYAQRGA